jgi:hypothetical protein
MKLNRAEMDRRGIRPGYAQTTGLGALAVVSAAKARGRQASPKRGSLASAHTATTSGPCRSDADCPVLDDGKGGVCRGKCNHMGDCAYDPLCGMPLAIPTPSRGRSAARPSQGMTYAVPSYQRPSYPLPSSGTVRCPPGQVYDRRIRRCVPGQAPSPSPYTPQVYTTAASHVAARPSTQVPFEARCSDEEIARGCLWRSDLSRCQCPTPSSYLTYGYGRGMGLTLATRRSATGQAAGSSLAWAPRPASPPRPLPRPKGPPVEGCPEGSYYDPRHGYCRPLPKPPPPPRGRRRSPAPSPSPTVCPEGTYYDTRHKTCVPVAKPTSARGFSQVKLGVGRRSSGIG